VKSVQQQQQERRRQRLEDIERQVKEGTLVIRKMTPEERRLYPPRPQPANAPRGRRARATTSSFPTSA
jgi:hypothetical protein